jgi:hypothetical protein
MLKKTITYEDYNGNKVVEDFYFHLRKSELIELEVSEKGGLVAFIHKVVEAEDTATLVSLFKKLILMSYGKRSEDGREFEKSEELSKKFSQTEAYSELFMELATNSEAAAAFMNGIIPAGLQKEVEEAVEKRTIVVPAQEPKNEYSDMSKEQLLAMLKDKVETK